MKKIISAIVTALIRVLIFFSAFLAYHIIFSSFFSVDENNSIQAPMWYIFVGIGLSVSVASLYKSKKDEKNPIFDFSIKISNKHSGKEDCVTEPATEAITEQPQTSNKESCNNIEKFITIEQVDKMDGHVFEYWCANLLSSNGFDNVEVTKGSGDQGVDILAEKDDIRYAIQCKNYSSDLGNKPVQEVNTGKVIYHCQIGAVMTNRYFTKGAIEAAQATGVLLWDRKWLLDHMTNEAQQQQQVDPLYFDCVEYVSMIRRADPQSLINRFHIGYARAARIIDSMEENGIVGPFRGSNPREVLTPRNYIKT